MAEDSDGTGSTRILIIDSSNVIFTPLIEKFEAQGWAVTRLAEIGEARDIIRSGGISVALLDADDLDSERYHFATDIARQHPEIITILTVGFESQADLDDLSDDDIDYIVKPVRYKPIASMIRRGLRNRALRKDKQQLEAEVAELREQVQQLSDVIQAGEKAPGKEASHLPAPEGGVIRSYERQQQTLIRPRRKVSRKLNPPGEKDSSGD